MWQFPPNPAVGQVFTPIPGMVFRWNGTAWFLIGQVTSVTVIAEEMAILYAIALG